MKLWEKFIEDVNSKPENFCREVIWAVKRWEKDLVNSTTGVLPYFFDEEEADRVISLALIFKHTKGKFKGKTFDLQPYQAFILVNIFGWFETENPEYRRFTKAYLETARKSGKSEFAALIACLMTFFMGEGAPQTFLAATKSDQANYVFEPCKEMCKMFSKDSEIFSEMVSVRQYRILNIADGGYISRMTADSETEDGADVYCGIIDEYHAHKDNSLLKVIETGTVARQSPLTLIVTTAGFNMNSACYEFRNILQGVLSGEVSNENLFGIIFTLDPDDDWHDETKWIKANPNIGNTPLWRNMRDAYQKAITEGSTAEVEFLTKNLNVWTDTPDTWVAQEKIKERSTKWDLESMKGRPCFLGLDLSASQDLTAVAQLFPPVNAGEKFKMWIHFYGPDTKVNGVKRVDQVDYRQWAKDGWIKITPGNVIDYDYIYEDICKLSHDFDVQFLEYDPAMSDKLIPKLESEGINCSPYRQGFISMNPAIKRMEIMLVTDEYCEQLDVGSNPVFLWHMANVVLDMDAAGNRKITKKKSTNKVDGAVAAAMAIGGYITDEPEKPLTVEDLGILN